MPRPTTKVDKPKNIKSTSIRLFKQIFKNKVLIILIFGCIVISSLCTVIATAMLQPLIDNYIEPFITSSNADLMGFAKFLFIMGMLYLMVSISTYVYSRIIVTLTARTLNDLRDQVFAKLQRLPISFHDKYNHGEIMSRFTNDTNSIRELISSGIPQLVSSGLTIFGIIIAMFILNPLMAIIIIASILLMLLIIKGIASRSAKYFKEQQLQLSKTNGYIEELVSGQKVVKVFSHEDKSKAEFEILNDKLFNAGKNANIYGNILYPIMNNLSNLQYIVTAIIGGLFAINGVFGVGAVITFLQYTRNITSPISQISQQISGILSALAGAERIYEIIDQSDEIDDGNVTLCNVVIEDKQLKEVDYHTGIWAWKIPINDSYEYKQLKGDVRFNNVTFGYKPEKTILHNITLYAKPGQKIAFVGSTGAGKTTITNLLTRFYEVNDGEILYDGINIKNIKKDSLRKSLSMVLQDTHLFTGTVRDNIKYGNLNATNEEIMVAAELSNAHSFIKHLPEGYDTILTADGANLSQGQRQLLSIARSTVSNPPVLVLDEATSSIDTRTEQLINDGMEKLMQGRTVFVIAHRLSTVQNSNAIIVIEKGEIIERGDHDELLKQKGRYFELCNGTVKLS